MHKTTTLKDFKVLVLKTFLPILVLSISFQVMFAQRLVNGSKGTVKQTPTTAIAPIAPKVMVNMAKSNPGLMPGSQPATSTDVPALNQQIAEKLSKNALVNPSYRLNSPTTSNIINDVCSFDGSLAPGDAVLPGARFFRDGVASACGSTKACAGTSGTSGYFYDTYTLQNLSCATQCVTVKYTNVGQVGDLFVVAYNGSFNPASLCTNYRADGGGSVPPGFPAVTFGLTVAANQTIVFVVMSVNPNETTPAYNLTVTGLNCTPPPPCTPIGPSVLSQTAYPGPPVNLINEGFNTSVAFPGSAMPAGWTPYLNSAPPGLITVWYSGNQTGVFPGQVGDYLAANYNHAGAALGTLSSWAVAPAVLLQNGDQFSFYTRHDPGNARPDRLQVRMATTGATPAAPVGATGVGDYTTLLLDINPTYQTTGYPTVWQQYTITLSGLAPGGVTGRMAFRYFCENSGGVGVGINSDYIGIDEVKYTTFPTFTPTTCPGSTTCLNVAISGGNPGATYNVVINAVPATPGYPRTITNYASGDCIPVTPAVNTTYSLVSVIDANNPCCVGTGNSGTPTVTITPGPITPIAITANPSPPLCAGDPTLLTVIGAPGAASFTSAGGLTIPSFGIATPYPLPLPVAGLPAGATVASVRLTGFTHTWAGDVDIALTGPTFVGGGNVQAAMLLSDLGNDALVNAANVNLTFSDAAVGFVPTTSPMVSGTYKCTNNGAVVDAMPAPGPTTTAATPLLTQLNAAIMNGTWNLWANDQVGGDQGSLASYTINFAFPPSPPPIGWTWLWSPAAGLSSTTTNPVAASPSTTRQYTVLGTAPGGCQTTASILITVNQLPAVTTNPSNVTACAGTTVTFTGAGTGAGVALQWQLSTTGAGGPWVNLTNTAPYSGVTTGTLTITGVTNAMNGYRYRLALSGICPPVANSTSALLTVNALPVVSISPVSPVCGGIAGTNGTALTASGANTFVWSPATGLYNLPNGTSPYIAGTNQATVYAAPTVNTIYTVTGTNTGTGCFNTASIRVVYTPAAPTVNPNPVAMCNGDAAVQMCITSSLAPAPFTSSFSSGPINIFIPEGNFPAPPPTAGVSTINVPLPTTAQVTGIRVTMNITHAYVGDVIAVLKGPNGQIINLDAILNKTNNPGANFVNTVISSSGTTLLSAGTAPFTGTFKADLVGATFTAFGFTLAGGPVGYTPTQTSWNSFLSSSPTGDWTLALYDAGAPDVGNLTSWSIAFDYLYGPPAPGIWSPAAGLYTDAAATIPYVAGTSVNCVYAKPLPFGVYPYNVTVSSIGFPGLLTTFSNPAPITIPSSGPATPSPSTITVSGLPTSNVSVENVIIRGFSHTWAGDVNIALQSPTGQNVILMANSNADPLINVNNVTLTLSDTAANSIPTTAIPTGSYKPTNRNGATFSFLPPGPTVTGPTFPASPTLATFTGDLNGTWKLFVEDRIAGDQGQIANGWTLTMNSPFPGCTSPQRSVVVTVNTLPVINSQPSNTAVCTDKVATFTVGATIGLGTISYRWEESSDNGNTFNPINNGGVYSGATTATLTITAPPVSMSGNVYRCKLQGPLPCAAVISFQRVLTVNPLPVIVIGAAPYQRLFPGLRTTFTSSVTPFAAAANGYVWLRNGVAVPGGNTGILVVDVDGLGDYQLRVTDVNGCTNVSNIVSIRDSVSGRCFIYPNPNSGLFQVRYYSVANNVLPRALTVYDAKGERVLTQFYTIGRPYDRMDVDIRKHGKGLYWVEIGDMNGNRLTMCRIVVQ